MKKVFTSIALLLFTSIALGQIRVTPEGYPLLPKKPSTETLADNDSIMVQKDDGIVRNIAFGDFKTILPAGGGGDTYIAGNGLNLNTNEFSVDTTRVTMIDVDSPLLGRTTFAIGTTAQLDALSDPVGYRRIELATDGDIASGGFSGSFNDLTDVPANLDTDSTDDFSGDFNDLTNVPANLDLDSTDDFDGQWSSLTGVPSGLADGDDDTIADGSETIVTAGTNVTVTGSGTAGSPYVVNSTASGGVSDHGGLTGLGDDDHPQYLRATGTDDIEGTLRLTTGEINFNGVPGSNLSIGSDPEINIPVGGAFKFNYNGTQIGQFNANGLQMLNGFQLIPVSETYNISGWDGDTGAPNKNNLRDYFALFDSDGDGAVNNLEDGTVTEAKIATAFYDDGTFTPTLTDAGGGATYTLGSSRGSWVKVGKQVTIELFINLITTTGTASGALVIGGVPSALDPLYPQIGNVSVQAMSINAPSGDEFFDIQSYINSNGNINLIHKNPLGLDNQTQISGAFFDSGSILVTITYKL